ncbi:WXG100 family type VII secretion target [Streptomyces sp. NPDC014734]|uniref:WXG100 family type VII secretion target n=1 Tax=Streptomyces sp. NPDC014734 TaxID=3364886 RepID=UPI0036FB7AEC
MTTSFSGKSHEEMMAWLSQANNEAVQAAADRLSKAATEIDKIGEELKIRPQWVNWKGAGAQSFRTWTADLANATLSLAQYGHGASKSLSEAAEAIVTAKGAAPDLRPDAKASLEAALSTPNDPDASALVTKLNAELRTDHDAMARAMTNLSQAYEQSSHGLGKLKMPKFPPPPTVIAPDTDDLRGDDTYIPGGGGTAGAPGAVAPGISTAFVGHGASAGVAPATVHASVAPPVGGTASRPVGMEIDGLATPPTTAPNPPLPQPGVSGPGKVDGAPPVLPPILSPNVGGKSVVQLGPTSTGGGRETAVPRPPMSSGGGRTVVGPSGRPPQDSGITGGRQVTQPTGRSATGFSRGPVAGGEGTQTGRGMMGHGPGMGGTGGGGQSGIVGGRRLASETGGVVGGRPQQPGRAGARPFTPGGTGLVRSSSTGDSGRGVGPMGRGGSIQPKGGDSRSDERGRPDYLVEDEETWQQGDRRVVPPVID